MCNIYIYICTYAQTSTRKTPTGLSKTISWDFKPKFFKFPKRTVKISTKIMNEIKHCMHFLTLARNKIQQWGMFKKYILCTRLLCNSVLFIYWVLNCARIWAIYNIYFIMVTPGGTFSGKKNINTFN